MATFSLGNVPSPIAQAMRLAQLRELQNPNLAMERQIQQAAQLQQLQQQSPEAQLALQLKQAQFNSALQNQAAQQQQQDFLQQQQPLILKELQNQLDPNYQLQQDARKLAFEVSKAIQVANATDKNKKGTFNEALGLWIKEVDGKPVVSRIPFPEDLTTSAPTVSASDIPSINPQLYSEDPAISTAPIIPTKPAPRTITGTIEQKAAEAERLKKEEQTFRENLQERQQNFTAEQNKLQREYGERKEALKASKGAPTAASQQFLNELSQSAITTLDDLDSRVSEFTTGFGSLMKVIPRSKAVDFAADLETLTSDIKLGVLQQMKSMSKTGASGFGQLSDKEGRSLESALGSLRQDQSPSNVKKNLKKIRASISRWNTAVSTAKPEDLGGAPSPAKDSLGLF